MQNFRGNEILLDTYAWIEYFRGSDEGREVKRYIESDVNILTPTIVLAELSDKYRREGKSEEWEEDRREIVKLRSEIVPLSSDTADEAGEIKREMREEYSDFPLTDGMILALTRENKCKVLTGDRHMRDLEEALNLKE